MERAKIANSSLCCKYIDDALSLIRTNRYLEWDINFLPFSLNNKRMSYVRDVIKEYGDVRFHLPYGFWDLGINDETVFSNSYRYYCRLFAAIESLDLSVAVLHIGAATGSDEETAIKGLKQLVPIAKQHGVKLCLETLIHGLSSDMDFIKRCMEIDGLYLCLDTGHVEVLRRQKGDCIYDAIASIKDKILHAHVYDYEDDNMNHVPFTSESIKTNVWLPLLLSTDCKWFTMELDFQEDQDRQKMMVEEYLRNMR